MLKNQTESKKLIDYLNTNNFSDIQTLSEYHKHTKIIIINAKRNYTNYQINLCESQVVVNMTTIDRNDIEIIKTAVHKYGLPICEYI